MRNSAMASEMSLPTCQPYPCCGFATGWYMRRRDFSRLTLTIVLYFMNFVNIFHILVPVIWFRTRKPTEVSKDLGGLIRSHSAKRVPNSRRIRNSMSMSCQLLFSSCPRTRASMGRPAGRPYIPTAATRTRSRFPVAGRPAAPETTRSCMTPSCGADSP